MAIQCCGEHLHTEAEVRLHNETEHKVKNKIEVRSWWKRFFLGKFKYDWRCPIYGCYYHAESDREDLIIYQVLAHEETH